MVKFTPEYRQATASHRGQVTGDVPPETLLGTYRVDIRLVEDTLQEATMRDFRWLSDEPPERGGKDSAPNPLAYFVSGLGFCQMVHFAGEAARNNIALDSIQNSVRGKFDRGRARRFLEFIYDLRIESPDPPENIKKMVENAEKFCFVSNTLARTAKLTGNIYLNGALLLTLSRGPGEKSEASN